MVDFTRDNPFSSCMQLTAADSTVGQRGEMDLKQMIDRLFVSLGAQPKLSLFRGFDTGLNQYVTWKVQTLNPLSTQTTPNFTGSLIDKHIEVP